MRKTKANNKMVVAHTSYGVRREEINNTKVMRAKTL